MVHPMGDVLITVTAYNKVRALSVDTGLVLDTLDPGLGYVRCMRSCDSLPVIVFGNENGVVFLFSVFGGKQLQRITLFSLSEFTITDLLIDHEATHIVALDESNALFVIYVSFTNGMVFVN